MVEAIQPYHPRIIAAICTQHLVAALSSGLEIVSGRSSETDDDQPRLSKRERGKCQRTYQAPELVLRR
jgi:hypothetical protein